MNQARSAIAFAGLSGVSADRILEEAAMVLSEAEREEVLVQHIVRRVTDAIIRESGKPENFDIYEKIKERSNRLALEHTVFLRETISSSGSPLETGLKAAVSGNIIDFGAKDHRNLDLEKEIAALLETSFGRYDFPSFQEKLSKAESLLYICDNCGEIVFDALFMEQLKKHYPSLEITAAFREKPIINDATLKDAEISGMKQWARCISSGSVYPGTILSETTAEFQDIFESADLILSKGQGNFETLLPEADDRLFFLLRIKCEYMASLSGVEKDKLVLIQGEKKSHSN